MARRRAVHDVYHLSLLLTMCGLNPKEVQVSTKRAEVTCLRCLRLKGWA
jgi:hypothetical protein